MRKIFLHIGMHKTGSTAIQSAYKGYDDGVTCYANLGYENHSIPLYTIFSGNEQRYHIWNMARLSAKEIEQKKSDCSSRLKETLSQIKANSLILSGEDISILPESGVTNLAKLLKSFGFEVKVIAYVRAPISFIVSDFQEVIKAGKNVTRPAAPNFYARFEKFIRIFGRENVEIREFSRTALVGGDILSDFAAVTNTKVQQKGKSNNESLSTEALRIVFVLNQLVDSVSDRPALFTSKQNCVRELKELFPGKADIPHDIISALVDPDDVQWLAEVSGIDFSDDVSDSAAVFDPARLHHYLNSLEEETVEKLSALLKRRITVPVIPLVPQVIVARFLMSFFPTQSGDKRFDPERYLILNPDVKRSGVDPYRHFVEYGMREGRSY